MTAPDPAEFDERIVRTIPRYDEMISDAVDYVLSCGTPMDWLDAGGGTGNLVRLAADRSPFSGFTIMDTSSDMLALAEEKLGKDCRYVQGDVRDPPFGKMTFDAITCIQCLHYLDADGRRRALSAFHEMLGPNGVLVYTEHIAPNTPHGYESMRSVFRDFLTANGRTPEEADRYLDRYGREYFPLTVEQHLSLLRDLGYSDVEMFWYSYGQAGFAARR